MLEYVEKEIKRYEEYKKLWALLSEYVNNHKGQKITKRIATELQEKLPDYYVWLGKDIGTFRLKFREKKDNGETVIFYIGRYDGWKPENDITVYNPEYIAGQNVWAVEAQERIDKYEASKEKGRLSLWVLDWNRALDALKKINEEAEAYSLQYLFDFQRKK